MVSLEAKDHEETNCPAPPPGDSVEKADINDEYFTKDETKKKNKKP